MSQQKHKVFVSFHHEDQISKDRFVQMMGDDIVDKSIEDGDIDDLAMVDTVRRNIRDNFIADATVTVVLIGRCTWQRKYVDWEIGSSLSHTLHNSRCGLLGILLPNHQDFNADKCHLSFIPPRLADNCAGENSFAKIYDWIGDISAIKNYIHQAFLRREMSPNNSRDQFAKNRSGYCSDGWSD